MDLTPLCTLDLMEKIKPAKLRIKEVEDRKVEEKVGSMTSIRGLSCAFSPFNVFISLSKLFAL